MSTEINQRKGVYQCPEEVNKSGDGSSITDPDSRSNITNTPNLIMSLLQAGTGQVNKRPYEVQPPIIQVESVDHTELSPERSACLATLKTRYETNKHGINRHGLEWSAIAAKLIANPEKIDTLKAMEDSGGAPDVYKVDGDAVIFGDLSAEPPIGRRNIRYQEAVDQAKSWGAVLMSPNDYEKIGNDLGIEMDEYPWYVWLASSEVELSAARAVCGYRNDSRADVRLEYMDRISDKCAFRCSLSV